ncbi:MAG: zf-HC2 domain-containing protein [Verrucomicrobia bacterium]|nr:zf-HC2 domain-containing protein [Verrucomicrobiota bacterium]
MNCAWYERWLTASADDELTGWRDGLLRRHLAGCTRCALELAELRRVRELVAGQKAHYVANLDDQFFWQRLRTQLQTAPQPEPEPEGELVMAYSSHQKGEPREPAGVAFWGLFPTRWLAWGVVAVALVAVTLISVHLTRAPQNGLLVDHVPLLPPPGQSQVHFTEVKSAKGLWAGVMKFDEPDTAIPVIWVDGMPYMGKELNHPSNEL